MVTAFVLINVEGKCIAELAQTLLDLDGVKELHVVAGEYDMVAVARVRDNTELSQLITKYVIHTPGVARTKTLFALESHSAYDLSAFFGVE